MPGVSPLPVPSINRLVHETLRCMRRMTRETLPGRRVAVFSASVKDGGQDAGSAHRKTQSDNPALVCERSFHDRTRRRGYNYNIT